MTENATAVRLNELASLIQRQWPGHVPLSLRYAAAEAADSLVAAWFDGVPAFLATLGSESAEPSPADNDI